MLSSKIHTSLFFLGLIHRIWKFLKRDELETRQTNLSVQGVEIWLQLNASVLNRFVRVSYPSYFAPRCHLKPPKHQNGTRETVTVGHYLQGHLAFRLVIFVSSSTIISPQPPQTSSRLFYLPLVSHIKVFVKSYTFEGVLAIIGQVSVSGNALEGSCCVSDCS